jgi:hypothetical protein
VQSIELPCPTDEYGAAEPPHPAILLPGVLKATPKRAPALSTNEEPLASRLRKLPMFRWVLMPSVVSVKPQRPTEERPMHGQYSEVLNHLAVVAFIAYSNERAAERAHDAACRTGKTTNGAARGLAASVAAALRRLRTAGIGLGVARVRSR